MFYSLTGKVVYSDLDSVAVDCNGVAYLCKVSSNTLQKAGGEGSEVTLYTYLSVRQDGVDLFGFCEKEELNFFKLLTTVSGVGPKAAMSILSVLDPTALAMSIAGGDYKKLTKAQGVGPKVAQRIVLELKDKVAKEFSVTQSGSTPSAGTAVSGNAAAEAISALVMLGYGQAEAARAVSKLDPSLRTEDLIKQALRELSN